MTSCICRSRAEVFNRNAGTPKTVTGVCPLENAIETQRRTSMASYLFSCEADWSARLNRNRRDSDNRDGGLTPWTTLDGTQRQDRKDPRLVFLLRHGLVSQLFEVRTGG